MWPSVVNWLDFESLWTAITWTWYAILVLFLLWSCLPLAIFGTKRLLRKNIRLHRQNLKVQEEIRDLLSELLEDKRKGGGNSEINT